MCKADSAQRYLSVDKLQLGDKHILLFSGQDNFFLKKSIVRSQAKVAAARLNLGVVSL